MSGSDDVWRRRFALFSLLRLSGLLLFLLGMGIAFSGLVREGGHLELGLVVIGTGLVSALLGPVLLRQHWAQKDGA